MSESKTKFTLEGIVTIGKRGQLVLPKDIRKKALISPNDKLVIVVLKKNEEHSIIVTKNELPNL